MRTYHFVLRLPGIKKVTPDFETQVFESGCDDALLATENNSVFLEFDRDADSLLSAVSTAIQAVATVVCPPDVCQIADSMVEIVSDPHATSEERQGALYTLLDCVGSDLIVDFESFSDGQNSVASELGDFSVTDLVNSWNLACSTLEAEFDQEEAEFARRVKALMKQQGLTQSALAKEIGVGQSAVAMMLNRKCRPQSRTIDRIAHALNVPREEIWPFES